MKKSNNFSKIIYIICLLHLKKQIEFMIKIVSNFYSVASVERE